MSSPDYLKNEAWKEIASTTSDVELKECLMRGHGEVEELPHDELALLYTKRRKYKILDFGCGIGRQQGSVWTPVEPTLYNNLFNLSVIAETCFILFFV